MKTKIAFVAAAMAILASAAWAAENRLWNPYTDETPALNDGAQWDATFTAGDDVAGDTFVINSETNATLAADWSVGTLYVGRGVKLENGEFVSNAYYDLGARLDMSAGTLTVANALWVGGGFADYRDCILDMTGGKIVTKNLYMGDCASRTDSSTTNLLDGNKKANYLNIHTNAEVQTTGEMKFSTYKDGTSFITVDGGTLTGGGYAGVGETGDGTVVVENDGSWTNSGEIHVGGNSHTGEIILRDGATLRSNGYLSLGNGGPGKMTVTNATLVANNSFGVGATAAATLNVQDGASVKSGELRVGYKSGGIGVLNISGGLISQRDSQTHTAMAAVDAGSVGTINMTGGSFTYNDVYVGNNGKGELNLSGGTFAANGLTIGNNSGSEGVVNYTGGTLSFTGLTIGNSAGSIGTFKVSGGNVTHNAWIPVGNSGSGVIEVSAGTFSQTSGNLQIGQNQGSAGAVRVSGTGAFSTAGEVFVGRNGGTGELTISDSGTFTAPNYIWVISLAAQTAVHSELNLLGGVLDAEGINTAATSAGNAYVNWNGGTFRPNAKDQYVFKNGDKLIVAVGCNGAIFDSNGKDRIIDIPLAGDGFFKKSGAGATELAGAVDLKRGFVVEQGTLTVSGMIAETTETTPLKEISVANGATLDLNGQTVHVHSYAKAGVAQDVGTYENEQGGTIIVVDASPVAATWTNAAGDGDVTNPANWTVRNAAGAVVYDVLPTAATVVTFAYGAAIEDFSGVTAKEKILSVAGGKKLHSTPVVPAVVSSNAIAWYDAADADTVTTNASGIVSAVSNKGVSGASLNLACAGSGNSVDCNSTLNGNAVFGFTASTGLVSSSPSGISGHGDRTLLAVSRKTGNAMYHLGLDSNTKGNVNFRMEDWPDNDGRHLFRYSNTGTTGTGVKERPYLDSSAHPAGDWGVYQMSAKWSDSDSASAVTGSIYFDDGTLLEMPYGSDRCGPSPELGTPDDATIRLGAAGENARTSTGDIAEAFVFDKALNDDELSSMRTYLRVKWFDSIDTSVLGEYDSLSLGDDAELDLNGVDVEFANIYGAGTISNGNVTVTGTITVTVNDDGTIDPLVIDGSLTLGAGAKLVVKNANKMPAGSALNAITATGGVSGEFASVETDPTGISMRAKVGANVIAIMRRTGFIIVIQ